MWSRNSFTAKGVYTLLEIVALSRVYRLRHRRFPENFAKCLRLPFFKEHLRWLTLPY